MSCYRKVIVSSVFFTEFNQFGLAESKFYF